MLRLKSNITRLLLGIVLLTGISQAQVVILNPPNNNVSSLHHIVVTIVGKAGADAKLYVNDKEASEGTIRIDGIYDFLNVEVPSGPVKLRVEAEGAWNKIYTAERDIHILGPPKQALPYETDLKVPADGVTQKKIRIKLQDAWGYTVTTLKQVTVSVTGGKIADQDINEFNPGIQVTVR